MRLFLLMWCTGWMTYPVVAQSPVDTTQAYQYYQTADSLSEQGRYEEAIETFHQAKRIYRQAGQWDRYIDCLNSLANDLWSIAAYDSATAVAQQVLQLSQQYQGPDHPEAAHAYDVLGIVQEYTGQYSKALAYYQRSLKIRKQHYPESHPWIANSYENLGLVYEQIGEYDQALIYHQKALTVRESEYSKTHPLLASSYHNIGSIYNLKGSYDQSLLYFKKALSIDQSLGEDHPDMATTYNNIAAMYKNKRAHHQALIYLQRALKIHKDFLGENHPNTATTYFNIGTTYAEQGMYEQALLYLQKALDIYKETLEKTHPRIATIYRNIGSVHLSQKNYDQALWYLQQATTIYEKIPDRNHLDVGVVYHTIGGVYKDKKMYEQALSYMHQSLGVYKEMLGEAHPNIVRALNDIGDIHYQQQFYDSALSSYNHGLKANKLPYTITRDNDSDTYSSPGLQQYLDGSVLLTTLKGKAQVYSALEQDALAYETYLLANSLLQQLRRNYTTTADKVSLAATAKQVYEGAIQLALRRYEETQDAFYQHQAFYFSEQSKASVLTESLAAIEARQFAQVPDSLLLLEASLKADRSFYRSQLTTEDSTAAARQLFATNQRYDSLRQVLEQQYPDYYQLKYSARIATVPLVQGQLATSEAVISYFVGDSVRYAFLVTADQYRVFSLHSDTLLDTQLSDFRRALTSDSSTVEQYQASAHALYQQLLAPIVADSLLNGIRQLSIIPDGSLGYLPFELLLTAVPAEQATYATLPYLLHNYTVRYGYSATWLFYPFARLQRPATADSLQYIAFAPSYADALPDTTQLLTSERFRSQIGPLRFNQQEAINLSTYLSGKTLIGSAAQERLFKQEASRYGTIHLAMHALVDDQNPMYSRLVFSPSASDSVEDGFLNAYELYDMELSADLAVLSACQTGYGKLARGEGIMSLAQAFAYAGCPSIVMSHWLVDDAASAQLMNHFYANLSNGLLKDQALQQAKLAYLQDASVQKMHPFFWGNFVLIGDTAPIKVSPTNLPLWVYALSGTVILLVLIIMLYIYQRRPTEKSQ